MQPRTTPLVRVKLPNRRHCESCGATVARNHRGNTPCCDAVPCWGGDRSFGGHSAEFVVDGHDVHACCDFYARAGLRKAGLT